MKPGPDWGGAHATGAEKQHAALDAFGREGRRETLTLRQRGDQVLAPACRVCRLPRIQARADEIR